MNRSREKVWMVIVGAMLFVSAVPALAQGPQGSKRSGVCVDLPDNFQVDPELRPAMLDLLEQSATFRRQCGVIAAARHVHVSVRLAAEWPIRSSRARAHIQRYTYGAIRAVVEVPAVKDYAELFGHELEHILEQMEGVDLRQLARKKAAGVVEVSPGVFETRRARLAGLTVAKETAEAVDGKWARHGGAAAAVSTAARHQ